jgi:hypothetical protein
LWLVAVCHCTIASSAGQVQERQIYDHHVHLLSPALIDDWKSIGVQFSRPEIEYCDPLRRLENDGLAGAFLV